MKYEIKSIGGAVLYAAELPDDTPIGLARRVALEKATASRANLSRANLSGANLSRAYLPGANLSGANLSWANLSEAYLSGANLSGAYLSEADLSGAYLSGAYLSENHKLIGQRPILTIGPIGSRCDYFTAYLTDKGTMIRAGCFFGTVAEFETACAETHGDNQHAREYKAALSLIAAHADIWSSEVTQ